MLSENNPRRIRIDSSTARAAKQRELAKPETLREINTSSDTYFRIQRARARIVRWNPTRREFEIEHFSISTPKGLHYLPRASARARARAAGELHRDRAIRSDCSVNMPA